jgi:gamma-glutamylcyclotransferase (GGCT)/AIG2-like uncharacterized protein YtfP
MARLRRRVARKTNTTGRSRRGAPAYLFVYGTLTKGEKRHPQLMKIAGTRFVAEGKMRGELYALPGEDYPGAVLTSDKKRFVYGEIYHLSSPLPDLRTLDKLEGTEEGLFRRKIVEVLSNGSKRRAWTYLYARPVEDARLIPSGIFGPA